MLKKLLVLSLVLGLAGVANATFSLTLNGSTAPDEYTMAPCDYIVIDVSTSAAGASDTHYLELLGSDYGEWVGGMTIYPAAGGLAQADEDFGYVDTWKLQSGGATGYLAGTHFEISFHCKAEGDVTINLYDVNWTYPVVDAITIHQVIPEPMTIALLGLGGLFLRRRK